MSGHKARVTGLQTLLAGTVVQGESEYTDIVNEFQQVYEAHRVRNLNRRHLLQILHSWRAVDTCIKAVIQSDGQNHPNSMGAALHQLQNTGIHRTGRRLSGANRLLYQRSVVRVRNDMLHNAGLYPASSSNVNTLLTDMHSCLQAVLSLT